MRADKARLAHQLHEPLDVRSQGLTRVPVDTDPIGASAMIGRHCSKEVTRVQAGGFAGANGHRVELDSEALPPPHSDESTRRILLR